MIQFHIKIDDDDDDDDDATSILIQIDTLPLVITFKFLQSLWQFCTGVAIFAIIPFLDTITVSASQFISHKIHCNPKVICTARRGFCSSKRV